MDFCLLLKMRVKILGKIKIKTSSGMLATCQKLLDYVKQSALNLIKTTSKKVVQKAAEANGDLIVNQIANRRKTWNYWWSKINIMV